jgi:hypothetical protein
MSTIQINLIRSPHGNGHDDDIIVISKTGEKEYSLSYKDKTAINPVPHSVQLDRDDVFDHLETTFDMLNIDIAPYKQIQILAPAFPSILLHVTSLDRDHIRENIFRVVESTMDNWPSVSVPECLRRSPRLAARTSY